MSDLQPLARLSLLVLDLLSLLVFILAMSTNVIFGKRAVQGGA